MKKIFKNVMFLCLIVITFLAFSGQVMAASYTVSLGSYNVTKGKSTTLYVKCSSVVAGFKVTSSNTSVASVSGSGMMFCDNNTETIAITTSTVGKATITITPTTASDNDGNDISLSKKTLTLTVSEPVVIKKSNDATLSSLSIDGGTLSPEFSKDKFEYTIELEPETTKVNVKAKANHSKANINGDGEVNVTDGSNKIEVLVTAEDGTTKTYVIVANVKELNPIKVNLNNNEYSVVRKKADLPVLELFDEAKVKIGEEEVVAYHNDKLGIYVVALKDNGGKIDFYIYDNEDNSYTKYNQIMVGDTTLYLKDSEVLNNNYQEYKISINDIETTIYKIDESEKVGLVYGVNVVTGNEGYYVYDIEEESLQRYYDKEIEIYKDKNREYFMALMVSLGIITFMIFISLIRLIFGSRKKKNKYKNKYK